MYINQYTEEECKFAESKIKQYSHNEMDISERRNRLAPTNQQVESSGLKSPDEDVGLYFLLSVLIFAALGGLGLSVIKAVV